MSLIEQGRQYLREQEMVTSLSREIFETGIRLLQARGKPGPGTLFFKEQVLTHTVTSAEPPVTVWLWAGANLDKARILRMQIQGVDKPLRVTRKKNKGSETFKGEYKGYAGYHNDLSLRQAQDYLSTIKQLERELGFMA